MNKELLNMPEQENGARAALELSKQLNLTSLEERWLAERWSIQHGFMPDSAADTLLFYAYKEKGVIGARIEFEHDKSPVMVRIVAEVSPLKARLLRLAGHPIGFWGKLRFLCFSLLGAPTKIQNNIKRSLSDYFDGASPLISFGVKVIARASQK